MFAKFYRTFHTTQNYPPHFEEDGENSFVVGFAKGNHSGLRGLPCLAEGIYWATGLSRTTPFTEGRLGVNNKASPPGRHREQAPKQRCTFRPTTFSSVQATAC